MKLTSSISKPFVALAALVAIGAGAGLSAVASAANSSSDAVPVQGEHRRMGFGGIGKHGVHGTVSNIDGSTLTVTNADGTSYTVDASEAKVSKVVELTVGDIKVGDEVGVMGEVSGTEVVAKHIMDGVPPRPHAIPVDN